MAENIRCPRCGTEYSPQEVGGELEGSCPRCLADLARGSGTGADEGIDIFGTAPKKPTEPAPLAVGASFRNLEVLELLGQGGMGFVYKARQTNLDRLVALKILSPKLATDVEFSRRFNREAKMLAALDHSNIVRIHEYGKEGELYFLTMDFVDGLSLRDLIREGNLKPEQALKIVPQICSALEYAHSQGVVHRDIKPENILLNKKGKVKIADFGLAKMQARSGDDSFITKTEFTMGTPHYMAPEQYESSRTVDHRADIFSLGVVFYEMLTGELPVGRFDPPSKQVQVDVRIDEIVLKALDKKPERRYQRAIHVSDAVTKVMNSPAPPPPSPAQTTKSPSEAEHSKPKSSTGLKVLIGVLICIFVLPLLFGTLFLFSTSSVHSGSMVSSGFPFVFSSIFLGFGFFSILGFLFSIWMIVDCIRRDHEDVKIFTKSGEYDKLIWIGLMIIFNLIAAVIYWFVVKRKNSDPRWREKSAAVR